MPQYASYGFWFSWSDQRKSLCEEYQIENTFLCSLIQSLRRQLGGCLLCLLGEYSLKLCTSLRRVFFTGRYQLPEERQICLPFPQNRGSFLAARFFLFKHIKKQQKVREQTTFDTRLVKNSSSLTTQDSIKLFSCICPAGAFTLCILTISLLTYY